jgi:site-specific recombinase XerD
VGLIEAMMKNTNEPMKHNDPFFVNKNGKMFVNESSDNSFGKRINEVFKNTGKKISCNILRHSFITDFLGKSSFSKMKDNTLEEVSKCLGHSAQMFQSYRRIDTPEARIDQFLKDDEE